jgi:hypothetical protein
MSCDHESANESARFRGKNTSYITTLVMVARAFLLQDKSKKVRRLCKELNLASDGTRKFLRCERHTMQRCARRRLQQCFNWVVTYHVTKFPATNHATSVGAVIPSEMFTIIITKWPI